MARSALEAREALLEPVRAGLEQAVLPALGRAGRPLTLAVPTLGRSSLVYLARVEGGPDFAVRVARDRRGRKDLRRRLGTAGFWTSRKLPTPSVVHADLSWRTRRATGLSFLCEELIDGENASALGAGTAGFAAVGEAFARVHAVERRLHHGSFHQPRVGPFGYRLVRRHGEWTRDLARLGAVEPALRARHDRWLVRFPMLHRGGPFQLHHRRCTESDVMVDRGGKAWVLEPQRCGFGSFMTDLVRIEERICHGDPVSIAVFHRGYFDAAPPERRALYDALEPVFRADLCLSNALRWARKRSRDPEAEAHLAHELERFRKITGA